MEDVKDIDICPGLEQARGETLGSPNSADDRNGVIIVENVDKIEMESKVIVEAKAVASGRKVDRSRKPKESAPKEAMRSKVTVPHPFTLATDKRMSQERRHSVDLSPSKEKQPPTTARVRPSSMPNLSKSVSCVNKRDQTPSDAGKARSKMENGSSTAANSKVTKRSLTTQNKQSQNSMKRGGDDPTGTSKLDKIPTFKALPLPSFYRRTDHPTSKLDIASKTSRRAGSPKRDMTKKRDIRDGAKETITKLIKSTRRAINQRKERVKSVVAAA